jgi:parallel beta-helix repeat protein
LSNAYNNDIYKNQFYRNIRFSGIIVASGSSNILIYNNVLSHNGDGDTMWSNGGISCGDVNYVTIRNNIFISNNKMGISIGRASGTIIIENEFISNIKYGLFISNSTNCNISNNNIKNSNKGIHITGQSGNTIISGNIISNNEQGLYIWSCNNAIYNNNIQDNVEGIFLGYTSDSNTISCNNFLKNRKHTNFELLFPDILNNKWKENFWDKSRLFPYIIFGNINIGPFLIPWINIDWKPAQEPWDI